MVRKLQAIWVGVVLVASLAAARGSSPSTGNLAAPEIVDKNVAARGGLQAWRAVQTLSLRGKLGAGGNRRSTLTVPGSGPNEQSKGMIVPQRQAEEVQLPFLMELKRGRKVRIELQFAGKTAIQVYDGTNGWKLRPFLNRTVIEPYTPEELKTASTQSDLDGFLVDYAAKGSRIELDGTEKVEGRNTYKLKVTQKDEHALHVWVDAETFLETKIEGQPRRLDGTEHAVEVYYRDYHNVDGLQIPFVLETKVLPIAKTALGFHDTPVPPEKIVIEKVVVNPKLDEKLFSRLEILSTSKSK